VLRWCVLQRLDQGIKKGRNMPQDRRDYHGDVAYEVWRSGGNPDRLNYDRVEDHRWNDLRPNEAARCEMNRWRCQLEAQQMQHDCAAPSPKEENYDEDE
jgi:hypothetical protein